MYIISNRVVDTINRLPDKDRLPISRALSANLLHGIPPESTLTPLQCIVYTMIRHYVKQDTERGATPAISCSFMPRGCAFG